MNKNVRTPKDLVWNLSSVSLQRLESFYLLNKNMAHNWTNSKAGSKNFLEFDTKSLQNS